MVQAETKAEVQVFATSIRPLTAIELIVDRYSTLTRIERVLAFCLRFISNSRSKKAERVHSNLSIAEISRARQLIIEYIQGVYFAKEIKELKHQGQVNGKSSLLCLNPFLDSRGLIRVGGRLEHSMLKYDHKHFSCQVSTVSPDSYSKGNIVVLHTPVLKHYCTRFESHIGHCEDETSSAGSFMIAFNVFAASQNF